MIRASAYRAPGGEGGLDGRGGEVEHRAGPYRAVAQPCRPSVPAVTGPTLPSERRARQDACCSSAAGCVATIAVVVAVGAAVARATTTPRSSADGTTTTSVATHRRRHRRHHRRAVGADDHHRGARRRREPVQLFESGADGRAGRDGGGRRRPRPGDRGRGVPHLRLPRLPEPRRPVATSTGGRGATARTRTTPRRTRSTTASNADTEPQLFPLADVDLSILPRLVDDAEGRFDLDVDVTHVLIDRFLPFDERVLIRVYATPTDGRSGGGYVQYTLDGTFVKTVQ